MASVLESSVFQNQQVPQSVMILTKLMPDISVAALSSILKLIIDVIQKNPIPPKALEKLLKKIGINANGDNLFCGLLMFVEAIVRLPLDFLKENDLRLSLKELKFTDECCEEFVKVFQDNKLELYNSKSKYGIDYFYQLYSFNWRIDISISSNFLAKALDTIIIFQLNLNNGESETFEVSVNKFQQLRFYVAYILKELEFIEKKSAFKP